MTGFVHGTAENVRAAIAAAMLGEHAGVANSLGSIALRPRQRVAAERLLTIIRREGGALLADPVGMGKTYTSLAVGARFAHPPTIVAPAGLRSMWRQAVDACGIEANVLSHEALSRGLTPAFGGGLVIVDEAHRFRSPAAKRYAMLASCLEGAPILLVSATPIQNRQADLAAQLALFLGRRAWAMDARELAAFVVRDAGDDESVQSSIPRLNGPIPLTLSVDDDCLDQILALPPPVAARDESIAAVLLAYGLVHQWASSRAALAAALRRRRTKGMALLAALDAGRHPTRGELSAWTHLDDAMQLAFPELVTQAASGDVDRAELTIAIDRHLAAIEALIISCRRLPDPDDERARLLAQLRRIHAGERIIAFCHYAETVESLRRRLALVPGVAALTARGAWVASGRTRRDVALSQFTPRAPGAPRADDSPSQRIDLLVTTDLASEGLNLQEASVVVHLDLPWNPARLDQRVGRVRRLGSRHRVVTVYSLAPPTCADRLLRVEDRLRDKLSIARRTVGVAGHILPPLFSAGGDVDSRHGLAEQSAAIDRRMRAWSMASQSQPRGSPLVAAVHTNERGFLAAIRDGARCFLIADVGRGIASDPPTLGIAIDGAEGEGALLDAVACTSTLARIHAYLDSTRATAAIDFAAAASARARRDALTRVARALARTPRHRRALVAPLADAARAVATASLGEGAERILEVLVRAELPDEAWLRSLATFAALNTRSHVPRTHTPPEIVALILFASHPGRTRADGKAD